MAFNAVIVNPAIIQSSPIYSWDWAHPAGQLVLNIPHPHPDHDFYGNFHDQLGDAPNGVAKTDYVTVTLLHDAHYSFVVRGSQGTPNQNTPTLELFDANGEVVASTHSTLPSDGASWGPGRALDVTPSLSGTYFLRVEIAQPTLLEEYKLHGVVDLAGFQTALGTIDHLASDAPTPLPVDLTPGPDAFAGGNAPDTVSGFGGGDTILGMGGNDSLLGGAGDDDLNGNLGADIVAGGEGADFVRGGQDNDSVYGDDGDDWHVNGNVGDDLVDGGSGNDVLFGGAGQDTLRGDDGDDTLAGNLDADVLFGGAGADVFILTPTSGSDIIKDFDPTSGDVLRLVGFGFGSIDDVLGAAAQTPGGLVIPMGAALVTLDSVGYGQLHPDHFLFV